MLSHWDRAALFTRAGHDAVVGEGEGFGLKDGGGFALWVRNQHCLLFSVEVTKTKNVIQVDVDTKGNYTVGPSQPPPPSVRATFHMGGLPGELGRMRCGTRYSKVQRDPSRGAVQSYFILCPVMSQINACLSLVPSAETAKGSTVPPLPPVPHYMGCIRNLVINQRHINLPRTGTVRGSIGLQGCPVL